jgi:hypothetical protein
MENNLGGDGFELTYNTITRLLYQEGCIALRAQGYRICVAMVFGFDFIQWILGVAAKAPSAGADGSSLNLDIAGRAGNIE